MNEVPGARALQPVLSVGQCTVLGGCLEGLLGAGLPDLLLVIAPPLPEWPAMSVKVWM